MNGDWPLPLPMVLGHEAAGIVVENGPGVIAVKPGDHVIFSFRPHCGRCRYCSSGRTVLCVGHNDTPRWVMHDGTTRVRLNGEPVNQMARIAPSSGGAGRRYRDMTRCSKDSRYSITSSARARRVGGTSRSSDLAVFKLMINSLFKQQAAQTVDSRGQVACGAAAKSGAVAPSVDHPRWSTFFPRPPANSRARDKA
jgi:hypothetical protein